MLSLRRLKLNDDLKARERELVDRIRRGREDAWGELLEIYLPRIYHLSCRWRIDEAEVYDVVIAKLQYAITNYRDGSASVWGFVKQLVDRALIDKTRLKENRLKTHLSEVSEHEEHGWGGALVSQAPEIVQLDFAIRWLDAHQLACKRLLYHNADPEIEKCFRFFLNVRRSQKCIGKASLMNVLAEFGMPDPQGKPIYQISLFADGFSATLVDDYTLVGERIIKLMSSGKSYGSLASRLGEPPQLINYYKRHWRHVSQLVAGDDEQELFEIAG